MGIKDRLEADYDFDVVDDFLDYLFVFNSTSEMIILSLEKKDEYVASVNELFRMFHNLKSASSYLHLDEMIRLVRLGEDILSVARELEGPASAEFINWLLVVKDQMGVWSEDINENRDSFEKVNKKIIKIPLDLEKK
jgi:two-component system chemotaxis sensor kinase CheA